MQKLKSMNSPIPFKIIFIVIVVFNLNFYAQKSDLNSSSIGIGTVNFMMHGDLTSQTPNLGYYLYFNKMITPAFGFELKGQFLNLKGNSQSFSEDYNVLYTTENADNLYFEGDAFGGELNLVLNFNGLINGNLNNSKLNFAGYFGIGYHTYNSKLFNKDTDELLVDFTTRNSEAKSIYYTSGLGLKYKLSDRLDIELRQSINFNNEDHLDATISNKQEFETFFTTQLGVSINLFKKQRNHENIVIVETETIIEEKEISLIDSDGDGVIDQFDKEPNTDKNALVYANGVTIDSDKDGVPDHLDKCPLIPGTDADGCGNKNSTPKIENILDNDHDGFPNTIDKCPNVHSLTNNGCPEVEKEEKKPVIIVIDTDNDGFSDKNDKCPNIYSKTNNGCPEKIIIKKEIKTNSEFDKEKERVDGIISNDDVNEVTIIINNKDTDISERIKNPNHKIITELNKNSIKHNVYELDNAVNVLNIDKSPLHPECKGLDSEFKIRNCLITKISVFSLKNFNTENLSKKGLNKGVNLMRVLFVIDENGKAKIHKIIGKWDAKIVTEADRVINLLPKIAPGQLNNIPTPVKFSIELPFKIN